MVIALAHVVDGTCLDIGGKPLMDRWICRIFALVHARRRCGSASARSVGEALGPWGAVCVRMLLPGERCEALRAHQFLAAPQRQSHTRLQRDVFQVVGRATMSVQWLFRQNM